MNFKESLKVFNLDSSELDRLNPEECINKIKKRYKLLAREYHPDKNTGSDELMTSLNNAYEILNRHYSFSSFGVFGVPFPGVSFPFDNEFFDPMDEIRKINEVNNILKSFVNVFKGSVSQIEKVNRFNKEPLTPIEITITPKEYFTGVVKVQDNTTINIPGTIDLNIPIDKNIFVKVSDPDYYFNNDRIHIRYKLKNINRPFVDPFGKEHPIVVSDGTKLKKLDGYKITIGPGETPVILVFV